MNREEGKASNSLEEDFPQLLGQARSVNQSWKGGQLRAPQSP
jgi:hypothetical protein